MIKLRWFKYLVTLLIVSIASGLQWLLWPLVDPAPFILFYPSVILASLYGDGLSAIFLSAIAAQYFFVPPLYSLTLTWPKDIVRQVLFILSALMIRYITRALSEALAQARSEKQKAQAAESSLSTTLRSIGDAVIATDRHGNVVFMNPVAEHLTEWALADAKGKPLTEVFHIINQQTRKTAPNPVAEVLEKGRIVALANHTIIIGRNGKEAAIEDSAAPIRSTENGPIEGVVLVFRDITEQYSQKEKLTDAFNQLQHSEARIRSILENALDAVIGMDNQGLITHWNPQAEKIFGYNHAEAVGKKMSEMIIPHQYREAHERGLKHYIQSGEGPVLNKRIEITALHRDGRIFPIELSITPVKTATLTFFAAFIRDITSVVHDQQEREQQSQALREAVQARDEFISICSHELKTPVTSMKLQFQMAERMLKKGDNAVFAEDQVRRRVTTANRQLDRMVNLIEEMLDVSRIEAGKLKMNFETVDLGELTREVIDRFSEQFLALKFPVEFELKPDRITITGDRYRLEQVLSNLLTNAIKYGSGSLTSILLTSDQTMARLTVRDGGIGISPGYLERIFERYEREVSSTNISGLGLGLYITRQIVEAHKGRIWVTSELGKGSTFTVELPL